jgi:hypothetical protein
VIGRGLDLSQIATLAVCSAISVTLILVARAGRIVEEFSAEDATEEKIMYAAIH